MHYNLYAVDGIYLGRFSALSKENALSRYNKSIDEKWGGIKAVQAIEDPSQPYPILYKKNDCSYCGGTGITKHRASVDVETGAHSSTVHFEDIEAECDYCSIPDRIERMEVQVDELIGTIRSLTMKLIDRLDIELGNYPTSTHINACAGDQEVPF